MNYYFEPVNLIQWNMFEVVKNVGHIEPFLAVKGMELGDLVFLHVGQQDRSKESGVYAYGEVVKEPYILKNSPKDYCNGKNTVDVKIKYISYDIPLLNHEQSRIVFTQFRTVHKLSDESVTLLFQHIKNEKWFLGDEVTFIAEEICDDDTFVEGIKKQIVVNAYERNLQAREQCLKYYKKINNGLVKCEICGFSFVEKYGEDFKDKIHIHHIVEISTIREEYVINPVKDLIPVCPNCHYILHCRKPAYTPNDVKQLIKK